MRRRICFNPGPVSGKTSPPAPSPFRRGETEESRGDRKASGRARRREKPLRSPLRPLEGAPLPEGEARGNSPYDPLSGNLTPCPLSFQARGCACFGGGSAGGSALSGTAAPAGLPAFSAEICPLDRFPGAPNPQRGSQEGGRMGLPARLSGPGSVSCLFSFPSGGKMHEKRNEKKSPLKGEGTAAATERLVAPAGAKARLALSAP